MADYEEPAAMLAVPLADARAALRLGNATEDALLTAMLKSATALCEQFTGLALMARDVVEDHALMDVASSGWIRLRQRPVRNITGVAAVRADGSAVALPVADYAIDIDAMRDGLVRVIGAMAPTASGARVRITYRAGIAETPALVPEALRHGIIQLAGHLQRERDRAGDGGVRAPLSDPPLIVAALWRPWRRLQL
jgi:uncharacterized phiE125 gp8 family phage protein